MGKNEPDGAAALKSSAAAEQSGRPEEAVAYLSGILKRRPGDADAARRLGQLFTELGRDAEAIPVFRRLLAAVPDDAVALVGLGLALLRTGASAEAEPLLRRCIERHPGLPGAYLVLATLLGQASRLTDVESLCRAFLQRWPNHGHALQLLGNSLHRQGRHAEALDVYRAALQRLPQDAALWDQFGDVLLKEGKVGDAEQAFRRAAACDPKAPAPLTNLGRIAEARGDLIGAIALHDRAVAQDPAYCFAYLNRGNARRFQGDFDGALADYDATLRLQPGLPEALGCRGFTLLTLGRLAEGWEPYAARIAGQPGVFTLPGATGWNGESLAGQDVVVWTEYGVGDEILFASLIPQLAAGTGRLTLLCDPRLVDLFARSFPSCRVRARDPAPIGGDRVFALADAARWLRPDFAAFPRRAGYLTPDPHRVAAITERLPPGLKVGIAWRSESQTTGPFKTVPLPAWRDVLNLPGLSLFSLQYGATDQELAAFNRDAPCPVHRDPAIDPVKDLDGFAAQVAAMDLIVSVSNTAVHVAGALGKPVWTLVPEGQGAHWYWFRDRADSPWYPSMRLFRQRTAGDWSPVLADIGAALRTWAAQS